MKYTYGKICLDCALKGDSYWSSRLIKEDRKKIKKLLKQREKERKEVELEEEIEEIRDNMILFIQDLKTSKE